MPPQVKALSGCVLRNDADPRKQVPIPGVVIQSEEAAAGARTGATGLFRLALVSGIKRGRTVLLQLRHPDYEPLSLFEIASEDLYVFRMTPLPHAAERAPPGPGETVANVRVRYVERSTATLNVGSVGKSFEVVNTGNVPCNHASACSPDGKWKAAIGGTSLDAGEGNEFMDALLTCIAGPCPFTRVDTDNFTDGGRVISASVRDWSDTVTFLLEAQVVRTMPGDAIHELYPVKFGRGMDFSLPSLAEGPSIEAEINGADIVYPLGPTLALSWTTCTLTMNANHIRLYHCDLKPGYRFQ